MAQGHIGLAEVVQGSAVCPSSAGAGSLHCAMRYALSAGRNLTSKKNEPVRLIFFNISFSKF